MKSLSVAGTALVMSLAAPCHASEPTAAAAPYDGDWSVVLDCADTRDKSGLVKGYEYTMVGKLEQSRGQAVRRELRPCTASFAKL
ncbi:MAG: hypothetical protein ABI624_22960 [Casimicrobiaceae bacterium]